jgi:hypothetical protein
VCACVRARPRPGTHTRVTGRRHIVRHSSWVRSNAGASFASFTARNFGSGNGRRCSAATGSRRHRQQAGRSFCRVWPQRCQCGGVRGRHVPSRPPPCLCIRVLTSPTCCERVACPAPEAQCLVCKPCAHDHGIYQCIGYCKARMCFCLHDRCPHVDLEGEILLGEPSRYDGVWPQTSYSTGKLLRTWQVLRVCKTSRQTICLGWHQTEEEAAHVSDLAAICLGVGTATLNFPASVYKAGGWWEEEAREAAGATVRELQQIWSRRAKQRLLDGVHSQPTELCRPMRSTGA